MLRYRTYILSGLEHRFPSDRSVLKLTDAMCLWYTEFLHGEFKTRLAN